MPFDSHFAYFLFQLQVLMDDTAQLLKEYPSGELRDKIAMSREDVIENWSELQRMVEDRKERLLAAEDYHRFQASVSVVLVYFLCKPLLHVQKNKPRVLQPTQL